MSYTVKITRSLIKNIGKVEIDRLTFEPVFVLSEETNEWLNINTIGKWELVSPTNNPYIDFTHEEERNWFILRWS